MAPLIPRLHLFEIADQSWFPAFLRAYVQTGLTHAWTGAGLKLGSHDYQIVATEGYHSSGSAKIEVQQSA
ncbi:hypothetical protein NUW58_g7856 [Xylaria curta]|uniref:Uncharacterized protein n=1 Tax=Xylaria curta TaxID=42375 RepID=A0ACC1NFJ5_9PEZI|nr:hypothetical protein NUW58_g7856 [Xylaria curta]